MRQYRSPAQGCGSRSLGSSCGGPGEAPPASRVAGANRRRSGARLAYGRRLGGYLTESPGFSTSVNDHDDVYHKYSTTWRGLEFLMSY
jgi:hypothetical protein